MGRYGLEATKATVPAMIALAFCVLASIYLVNHPQVVELDERLFLEINQHFIPGAASLFMFALSELGSVIWSVAICAALWMVGRKDLALALLLAFVCYALLGQVMKYAVLRPRPMEIFMGIEHMVVLPGSFTYGQSFPSGHTAGVFSILGVLIMKARRWAIPMGILAITVGFLRVFLGAHFPFDVIAGASVGLFGGILFGSLRYGELICRIDAYIDERMHRARDT